jgi:hypothetical protein
LLSELILLTRALCGFPLLSQFGHFRTIYNTITIGV